MRILRLLAVLVLVPGVTYAQGLTYGAKGGINFATLSFDPDTSDLSFRTGIVVGGFVALPVGSRLTIQPEGLFSQKGGKADADGVEATIELDYLEVPVLVKYALTRSTARAFHVFAGPSVAFKLRSKATATFGEVTVETDEDERIEDFDFGVVVGGGVDLGRLSIDGRYTFGLANINADDPDVQKIRSRTISVLAGFRF